jgi:hypothetical protein
VPEWACTAVIPSGIHKSRRVADVAAHDGVVEHGLYLRVRTRRPRQDWPDHVRAAVAIVAAAHGFLDEIPEAA